jgi:succinate dehydrogenase / fumarate reductase cytochrome b subunit
VLFLFAHMAGNLKIFLGAPAFDSYAHWLRTIGTPVLPDRWYLWIQRVLLTGAAVAHMSAATILARRARRARRARPVRYAHRPRCRAATRRARCAGVA